MEKKTLSLKQLLANTLKEIDLDAKSVIRDLSEKLIDQYTLTTLIDSYVYYHSTGDLHSFIAGLIASKETRPGEVLQGRDLTRVHKFYDAVQVFWINAVEDSTDQDIEDLINSINDVWVSTLKIKRVMSSERNYPNILNKTTEKDVLFIMFLCVYAMHVAMILTREESQLGEIITQNEHNEHLLD